MAGIYTIYTYTFKEGDPRVIHYATQESISESLFERSNVESVIIPDGIKYIGPSAFSSCYSLTSITIPNSVIEIDLSAFQASTNLPSKNNIIYADKFLVGVNDRSLTAYTIEEGTKWIGNSAFYNCYRGVDINIPDSVTSIGSEVFYLSSFKNLTIGKGLSSFSYGYDGSFKGCSWETITVSNENPNYDSRNNCNAIIETSTNALIVGASNTVIPNTVTKIEYSAFYNNSKLTAITIPNSVTTLEGESFRYCSKLESVTIESTTPPTMRHTVYGTYETFGNNKAGRKIYVPAESVDIYKSAEGWSKYADYIEPITA